MHLSCLRLPYSPNARLLLHAGKYIFVSGVTASDAANGALPSGDVREETRVVMSIIDGCLRREHGMTVRDIIKAEVTLTPLTKETQALATLTSTLQLR